MRSASRSFLLFVGLGLLSLSWSRRCVAQVLPFEVLGLQEGLPQSQVITVAQDAEGYIWAGTLGGLARYNGDTFTTFGADAGLPSNRVQEILIDRSGTLWVATQAGVSTFKNHVMTRVDHPLLNGQRCRALAEDAQERIWIGTDQGAVVFQDGKFCDPDPAESQASRVYDLIPDGDGVLGATSGGIVRIRVDRPPEAVAGPPVEPRNLARTAEGLWVGTAGHGLWFERGGSWHQEEMGGVKDLDIYRLSAEESGTLYASTSNSGVFFRRPGANAFAHWGADNGLPSNATSCAIEDQEGNIWIGTDIGGLARLGALATVNYGTATGLPHSCVFGISPGSAPDTLWVATMRGAALVRVGHQSEVLELLDTSRGLNNDWLWKVLLTPEKELWVLTDFSWQFRRPGQTTFESPDPAVEFIRGNAMDMIIDTSGVLWLGGDDPRGGLCRRRPDGRWQRWSATAEGSGLDNCRKLAVRKSGGVWVTQRDRILFSDGARIAMLPETPPLPSHATITSIFEDFSGRLWAGNDSGLAVRETDGRWRLANDTPGFSNHAVYSVGQDLEGTVWVGTARGVFRFQPNGVVAPLMPEDGLAGYETNANGFYCDSQGVVWIGTVNGMSRYEAIRDRPNIVPSRIVVESAELKSGAIPFPGGLDLDWKDRSVTFRVALLAFRGHRRCQYRARLEGFESDWLPIRQSPELRYTNLPAGTHRLMLQAVNESGVWGETVTLPIRIRPPFWQTWWFRLGGLGLVGLAAAVTHRWRLLILRRRNEELEGLVTTRTDELRHANEGLSYLAGHDALTGLPNRRAILEYLTARLEPHGDGVRRFGLLLLDLDNFKKVNDTLGHAAGDRVLCIMAEKLQTGLRDGDRLGRFGGDEFLLVLPGADLEGVETVARRVSLLAEVMSEGGQSVTVTVSCGALFVSGPGSTDDATVVAAADELLYQVKKAGRRDYRIRAVTAEELTRGC